MIGRLRRTETLFKLGLLAFILLLMWTGRSYPEKSRLFPELLGGVTLVLIMVSFAQDLLKSRVRKKKEVKEVEAQPADIREEKLRWVKEMEEKSEGDAGYEFLEEGLRRKRLLQSVVIILISLVIGYVGGFLLTVPFYFIAFGVLHGERKKAPKYVVIALGITVVIYLFFSSLMGVPLLKGLGWG